MDKILLQNLEVDAIVGILEWERVVPQRLLLSIELQSHITTAAKSEKIEDALNYAEVALVVENLIVEKKYRLIERLVEEVAALLLKDFPTSWVKVRCQKPQVIKNCQAVGIEIERGANRA